MLWNPDQNEVVCTHTLLQKISVIKSCRVELYDISPGVGFLTDDGKNYYRLTPTEEGWGMQVTCAELMCSSSLEHVLHYITSMSDVYIGAIYQEGGYYLVPRRQNVHLCNV